MQRRNIKIIAPLTTGLLIVRGPGISILIYLGIANAAPKSNYDGLQTTASICRPWQIILVLVCLRFSLQRTFLAYRHPQLAGLREMQSERSARGFWGIRNFEEACRPALWQPSIDQSECRVKSTKYNPSVERTVMVIGSMNCLVWSELNGPMQERYARYVMPQAATNAL